MTEDAPAPAPAKKPLIDWYQAGILSDRYLETILADWKNTGLLLIQSPILAGLAVMVWQNLGEATSSLYFVMTLSAIWLGCMDACREIVKERELFLREKMYNLNVPAYVYSKVRVLALLNVVQVVMYAAIITKWVDVGIPIGWTIINLLFSTLCGTCLGLMISASVRRSDYAVGLVPLVILPQILFSEFAIKKDQFEGVSEAIYWAMPSRWGFESLQEFAKTDDDIFTANGKLLPLAIMGLLFLVISWLVLRRQKY